MFDKHSLMYTFIIFIHSKPLMPRDWSGPLLYGLFDNKSVVNISNHNLQVRHRWEIKLTKRQQDIHSIACTLGPGGSLLPQPSFRTQQETVTGFGEVSTAHAQAVILCHRFGRRLQTAINTISIHLTSTHILYIINSICMCFHYVHEEHSPPNYYCLFTAFKACLL